MLGSRWIVCRGTPSSNENESESLRSGAINRGVPKTTRVNLSEWRNQPQVELATVLRVYLSLSVWCNQPRVELATVLRVYLSLSVWCNQPWAELATVLRVYLSLSAWCNQPWAELATVLRVVPKRTNDGRRCPTGWTSLNDGANEAEARHHLLLGIITCGILQPMAERFMDKQGIASARELSMLSDEEVDSAVKMHNHSITTG
eukprot:scaffold2548_cov135-Alexandrium_tamarense.AAC.2